MTRHRHLRVLPAIVAAALVAGLVTAVPATAAPRPHAFGPHVVHPNVLPTPLKGVGLDSTATQTKVNTMPFLLSPPANRGTTKRVISSSTETIPIGAAASVVYLAGMYNRTDIGVGTWHSQPELKAHRTDQVYVGKHLGDLEFQYADGSVQTVPLIFGSTIWTVGYPPPEPEPIEGLASATAAFAHSIHLHHNNDITALYLAVKVPKKKINNIVIADDPDSDGRPQVDGVTLATTDSASNLTEFNDGNVFDADRTPNVNASAIGDITSGLPALSKALYTGPSDLPASFPTVKFPKGSKDTQITFSGGREGQMLSNIWAANLQEVQHKFPANTGFFHESAARAPWYTTYGNWIQHYGLYPSAFSRTAQHYVMMALKSLPSAQRGTSFVDFSDYWLYYFRDNHDPKLGPPNSQLNGYPADAPPHWAYVLSAPQLSVHNTNSIPGNEELDGHCSVLTAQWQAWRQHGEPTGSWWDTKRPSVFNTSRWDSFQSATDFIGWMLKYSGGKLLYSEGEDTGDSADPATHYQPWPNYSCMVALRTGAQIAGKLGHADDATAWLAQANTIAANLPSLTTTGPSGQVWQNNPAAGWPTDAQQLAQVWFGTHLYGLDPATWDKNLTAISQRTFASYMAQPRATTRIHAWGYGQGWLGQTGLFLDQMDNAAGLLQTDATDVWDKNDTKRSDWKQWQWIVPEGGDVLPSGQWRRHGDLGNGAQEGEILNTLQAAAGVDDTNPAQVSILPRIPDPLTGLTVTNGRAVIAAGTGTTQATVSYKYQKSGSFTLHSDKALPALAVRVGPFASKSDAQTAASYGRYPRGAVRTLEKSGVVDGVPAYWVWVRGMHHVKSASFTFPGSVPQVSGSLTTNPSNPFPGQTVTAHATVTNNSRNAVRNARVAITAPAGWTVRPASTATLGGIAPGKSATATFRVTVPVGTPQADTVPITARASVTRPGASAITVPMTANLYVQKPVSLVAVTAGTDTLHPGQSTPITALVYNERPTAQTVSLSMTPPAGFTDTVTAPTVRIPGYSDAVIPVGTLTNTSVSSGMQTATVSVTADGVTTSNTISVFTGRLRCLLGDPTREDWYHDSGFSCTLDHGQRFSDPTGTFWPLTAPVHSSWQDSKQVLMYITVPPGTTGTLRLFIADYDNYQGGRKETITVAGHNLGTFSNFQAGKWITTPITAADTASGRINIQVDNARTGANATISVVEF